MCERRTNRNELTDQTKPLSARIASFDHANFWLNSHQVCAKRNAVDPQCEWQNTVPTAYPPTARPPARPPTTRPPSPARAQTLPEGSVVVERLTTQCHAVVDHLRDTTSGKVSVARMELYFKLDANNKWV